MNTGKRYYDSENNECSIWQMIQREPHWAATRIQQGEKAEQRIHELKKALEKHRADLYEALHDVLAILRDIPGIDDPSNEYVQLVIAKANAALAKERGAV